MKKVFIILTAVLCLLTLTGCGRSVPKELADVTIKTPYCDFVVSGDFAENVKSEVTSEDPYTVSFRMKSDGTELFSILFGGKTEDLLGTLLMEKENVVVYASFGELDREDANYETYAMFQDEINTIIGHLISNNDFIVNELIPREDTSTFDIETSVVTMKYPAKWQGIVTIDVSEKKVSFSNNDTPLFDLVFSECDGYLLGTYNGTPIYIVDYPVTTDEQAAMQEDVNVILQYLMEDPNFDINA